MSASDITSAVRQPDFTSREDATGIHLHVALPGVRKEDLRLTAAQSVLRIEGTRDNRVPDDWKNAAGDPGPVTYRLNARLAAKYDGANAKASFANGILTLDIPVREEARSREIHVN